MQEVKLSCKEALQLILDCVDYTTNACRLDDMVGAVLSSSVIELARGAIKERNDMRFGLEEHDWALVGAKLAQADDNDQAVFFKSFVKECLSWGTHYQVELQLAGVNRKLNDGEKDVLGMIGYKE